MLTGWLTHSFRSTYYYNTGYNVCSYIFMQTRGYAARKGTREKAKKKKIKVAVEKVGFIPHNKRSKKMEKEVSPFVAIDDSWKWKATDDVWIVKYHQEPIYSFEEAIKCHHEMHHPTMLNKLDVPLNAVFDLDTRREKKNKYVERFTKNIETPHIYQYSDNQRKVLALCKDLKEQEKAREANADSVGGVEIIKQIQNGDFDYKQFDHIVAHADIIPDLLLIRGLLKRRFPSIRVGNLGNNMSKLVPKFKIGIQYTLVPDKTFKEYAQINVVFGLLNMDPEQLEENFNALINDIESHKPIPKGDFIKRVQIVSKFSEECFKIDFKKYLPPPIEEESNEPDDSAIISTH